MLTALHKSIDRDRSGTIKKIKKTCADKLCSRIILRETLPNVYNNNGSREIDDEQDARQSDAPAQEQHEPDQELCIDRQVRGHQRIRHTMLRQKIPELQHALPVLNIVLYPIDQEHARGQSEEEHAIPAVTAEE